MATIHDVANRAGVSKSTVSRVLNNYALVSDETRNAVFAAMEELDYHPSSRGRASSATRGRTVLVISSGSVDSIIRGINKAANDSGYDMLQSLMAQESTGHYEKYMDSGLIAGVILLNINLPEKLLGDIVQRYPVVQCNEFSSIPDVDLVSIDNLSATSDITAHVLGTGKKRLAFISPQLARNHTVKFVADREYGFRKALEENGAEFNPDLMIKTSFAGAGENPAGFIDRVMGIVQDQILSLPKTKRPDAILCTNDTVAACCVNAIHKMGLRVPEDIAVTAFDNSAACLLSAPSLTTVDQPHYEMGYESVKLLISKLGDRFSVPRQVLLKHGIIVRESTRV